MIFDTLKNIDTYRDLNPRLYRGLQILRETDFQQYGPGNYAVEGDELFFMIQDYETRVSNDTPEAHQKYIDIQYLISGEEIVGFAPLETLEEVKTETRGDIKFYRGKCDYFTLKEDRFAVFFPKDAHSPAIAVNGRPGRCIKCVVKVKLS